MKRKTVYIPVDLAEQLEALSGQADVPETKIVSLALALLLGQEEETLKEALRVLKSGESQKGREREG